MGERVLLVKLAALGDVIMASTLVPAIRTRWPDAELAWVVGRGAAPLVRSFEGVDRVIEVDEEALLRRGRFAAAREVFAAWRAIGRGWDRALIAHTDPRYGFLARGSGASTTRRFAGAHGPRRGVWYGAQYARMLDDGTAVASYASLRADALPQPLLVAGSGPLVLLAPGGGRNILRDDPLRRWPIGSWERVAAALVARGHRVVAIGSAGDAAECAGCAAAGALDLSGRLSLLESLALMRAAQVVVTHDSGPLHMALLVRCPTVALFGPTRPAEFVPPDARVTVLSRAVGMPCAPCYDGFAYADCAANRCLSDVGDGEVVRAVQAFIA